MSQDHDRHRQLPQFLAPLSQQVTQDAFFQVENVVGAVGEINVAEVLEHLRIAAQDPARGEFGGKVPVPDQFDDFFGDLRVLHELQVSGENRSVLLPEVAGRELLVLGDLVADHLDGRLEAGDFDLNGVDADVALGNTEVVGPQDQGGPADDSRRDRDSAFDQHRVSSVNRRR